MSAPCRARPVTSEFWLRPATYRAVSSIAMNALDTRPLPIAFGGPGAVIVAGTRHEQARRYRRRQSARTPHDDQPVQLLLDVIRAQQRERHPALLAAVPALKVPDHLNPEQVRVIPPPAGAPGPR